MLNSKQLKEYNRLLKQLFAIKDEAKIGNDDSIAFFTECAELAHILSEESNLRFDHNELFRVSDPNVGMIDYLIKELSEMSIPLKAFQEETFALHRKLDVCMTDFMDFKKAITAEDTSSKFINTSTITMDKRINELQKEISNKLEGLDKYRKHFNELKATYNSSKN